MRGAAGALLVCWPLALAGQASGPPLPAPEVARAESLETAGRPWHAAESFLTAPETPGTSAQVLIANARAELAARRYARVVALLANRPWLADSGGGVGYAVLGEALERLGKADSAARDYLRARAEASGSGAALLTARAATAFDRAGMRDSARWYYAAARRAGLPAIDGWLRLREAGVTPDSNAADSLLAGLSGAAARRAPLYRARARLASGDSSGAVSLLAAAGAGLEAARLALARGDSAGARGLLYHLFAAAPQTDDAAAGVALAQGPLAPATPDQRIALAQVLRMHGDVPAAVVQVRKAIAQGDSSGGTLLLWADLLAGSRRGREALRADEAAERDSAVQPLASYRRARLLLRLGDPSGPAALLAFARAHPADSAAGTALYLAGDRMAERGDSAGAAQAFQELSTTHPLDPSATQARLRVGSWEYRRRHWDRAAEWFQADVDTGARPHGAARFWLGKVSAARGDSAAARGIWLALAHDDSTGYYGLRARTLVGLPGLAVGDAPEVPVPAVAAGLGALDTLLLAGLDSEADLEVRSLLAAPPDSVDALLAWSAGLAARGWGSVSVRLAWIAAPRAPGDPRVLRAIFPWPDRSAVTAEAEEFHVDPLLLAALIRQESVFDREALSHAGARGLAQLLPSTAARTARVLDLPFAPEWLTVPDLNLHLGAAHLAALLERYHGRVAAAVAAYDAGSGPVDRWMAGDRPRDPDLFVEDVGYVETRGYVRSVLRNRELYRALYGP